MPPQPDKAGGQYMITPDSSPNDRVYVQYGQYDIDYVRNAVINRVLKRTGYPVIELGGTLSRTRRLCSLARVMWDNRSSQQFVVVCFPGYRETILVKPLAALFNATIIFDPYYGLVETIVEDRASVRRGGLRHIYLTLLEFTAFRLADIILVDTSVHGEYYARTRMINTSKFRRFPISAMSNQTRLEGPSSRKSVEGTGRSIRVLFAGYYVPLQGIEVIVRAASLLASDSTILIIGDGLQRPRIEALARSLEIDNVRFLDPIEYSEFRELMKSVDIVLGIFGDSGKASRVVPNKVVDALASGMPVITADTPAVREFFECGKDIIVVPANDPVALAAELDVLASSPESRHQLGQRAYAVYADLFSEEALASIFSDIVGH